MNRALDRAMGWAVAVWLALAFLSAFETGGSYAPYACMAGAVSTIVIWAVVRIAIMRENRHDR